MNCGDMSNDARTPQERQLGDSQHPGERPGVIGIRWAQPALKARHVAPGEFPARSMSELVLRQPTQLAEVFEIDAEVVSGRVALACWHRKRPSAPLSIAWVKTSEFMEPD